MARKGFGISPKDDKSGLGCGKEDGCGLTSTVDKSGVWQVILYDFFPVHFVKLYLELKIKHHVTLPYGGQMDAGQRAIDLLHPMALNWASICPLVVKNLAW